MRFGGKYVALLWAVLVAVLPTQVLAEAPKDKPLEICMLSGSVEYRSDDSLAALKKHLESLYQVRCTILAARGKPAALPPLTDLATCDVLIPFTRRVTLDAEQLAAVKKYCEAGRPIVGIRTASHGFQNWLELDREVFGGNYHNHYGAGPKTKVAITEKGKSHPVLAGVKEFSSTGSLYKNTGIADDVELLMTGAIPGHEEPVAWARTHRGGRIFYTSLGHSDDFADENFRRLIVNAIAWTTKRELEPKATK